MNLDRLLRVFGALEDRRVEYAVVGDLAMAMQGRLALTECFEIVIEPNDENVANAREAIQAAWSGTRFVHSDAPELFRALPPDTPFYVNVFVRRIGRVMTRSLRGVGVRISSDIDDRQLVRSGEWSRPGFTLFERLRAVNSLSSEIIARRRIFRGVRKYRSIEAAEADRAAERLRN